MCICLHVSVCVPCVCLVPTEAKRGHASPGTGVRWLSNSVSTENWTLVWCKSSQSSYLLSPSLWPISYKLKRRFMTKHFHPCALIQERETCKYIVSNIQMFIHSSKLCGSSMQSCRRKLLLEARSGWDEQWYRIYTYLCQTHWSGTVFSLLSFVTKSM